MFFLPLFLIFFNCITFLKLGFSQVAETYDANSTPADLLLFFFSRAAWCHQMRSQCTTTASQQVTTWSLSSKPTQSSSWPPPKPLSCHTPSPRTPASLWRRRPRYVGCPPCTLACKHATANSSTNKTATSL